MKIQFFILFFSCYQNSLKSQNLVLNPKLSLDKKTCAFEHAGWEAPIQWADTTQSVFTKDTIWHKPWSSLSNCRYHIFISKEDTVQSEFVFGINSELPGYMISKIAQGQLCRTVETSDSVFFSMKLRFLNSKRKWNKKIRLIISVSDTAINRWNPVFRNDSNQQIVYNKPLKQHLADSIIRFSFKNNIDFKYFQITISSKRKKDYNYIWICDFFMIGKRTKTCQDFTF